MQTKEKKKKNSEDLCAVRCIHLERVKRAKKEALPQEEMERLARLFGALGDESRLRIIMALVSGEMCVCDLAAFIGISESAVSHQLRRLRDMALVKRRREGQVLYYNLDDHHIAGLLETGVCHIKHL